MTNTKRERAGLIVAMLLFTIALLSIITTTTLIGAQCM